MLSVPVFGGLFGRAAGDAPRCWAVRAGGAESTNPVKPESDMRSQQRRFGRYLGCGGLRVVAASVVEDAGIVSFEAMTGRIVRIVIDLEALYTGTAFPCS